LCSKGIEHELTMPYTAEQNGVAECGHQTITTWALSAHHQGGYPHSFWGYAILNLTYIKNFLPSSATNDRTPFELFYGELPDVLHLHPFGCLTYAHIPDDTRHKYEYVSRQCFFLGHVKDAGYLLWDPATRQTIRSWNVCFDESVLYGTPNTVISPLVELYNQHTLTQQPSPALLQSLDPEDAPEILMTTPSTVPVGVALRSSSPIPEPSQPFPPSNDSIPAAVTEDMTDITLVPEPR
jgi:hypothetical protein